MSTESEKPICGVCWEAIELGKSVGTPCNHTYCTTCFFKWIKTHNTCPLCRHDMLSKTYEGDRRELLDAIEDQISEATLEWRDARRATRAAEEMMKSCFSRSWEAADCCAQLKDKCGSGADSNQDCMAMFHQMQERCCGQANDAQSGKGSGCSI